MMKKIIVIVFILSLLAGISVVTLTTKSTCADDGGSDRIDEILRLQNQILKELDFMKQELEIIKGRAARC